MLLDDEKKKTMVNKVSLHDCALLEQTSHAVIMDSLKPVPARTLTPSLEHVATPGLAYGLCTVCCPLTSYAYVACYNGIAVVDLNARKRQHQPPALVSYLNLSVYGTFAPIVKLMYAAPHRLLVVCNDTNSRHEQGRVLVVDTHHPAHLSLSTPPICFPHAIAALTVHNDRIILVTTDGTLAIYHTTTITPLTQTHDSRLKHAHSIAAFSNLVLIGGRNGRVTLVTLGGKDNTQPTFHQTCRLYLGGDPIHHILPDPAHNQVFFACGKNGIAQARVGKQELTGVRVNRQAYGCVYDLALAQEGALLLAACQLGGVAVFALGGSGALQLVGQSNAFAGVTHGVVGYGDQALLGCQRGGVVRVQLADMDRWAPPVKRNQALEACCIM